LVLLASRYFADIGTFLNLAVFCEIVLIGSKLILESPDFPTNKTRQMCFLLILGVFACWIIYWSLMLAYLYGDFDQPKLIAACTHSALTRPPLAPDPCHLCGIRRCVCWFRHPPRRYCFALRLLRQDDQRNRSGGWAKRHNDGRSAAGGCC
jgi:hypothetical protein